MSADTHAKRYHARYIRLYADEHGESHFADVEVGLEPGDFAPPAPPLHVAPLSPTMRCGFVCAPVDWDGSIPHPSPLRQLMCTLRGDYEVTASDGSVRRFPAGSLLLLEDTTGTGHRTRVVGNEDVLLVAVALAE